MRVARGATVSGIVLRTRHDAVLLTPLDPRRRVRAYDARVGAERARLHDRVARLDIEIAHGRENPRQANGPRFGPRDRPGGVRRIEIVEIAERRGRRQLGKPTDLLPRPALEVGAEQQRSSGDVA